MMAVPRFRLRSLIVAIAFLALLLAVGLLSVENAKLRRIAVIERERAAAAEARSLATFEFARRSVLDMTGTVLRPPHRSK